MVGVFFSRRRLYNRFTIPGRKIDYKSAACATIFFSLESVVTVYTFAASVFDIHQAFPLVAFLALDLLSQKSKLVSFAKMQRRKHE